MLTTEDPLLLRHDDARGIVTLTLNRPQTFNSLSEAMIDATRCSASSMRSRVTSRCAWS